MGEWHATMLSEHVRLVKGVSYRKADLLPSSNTKLVNLACVQPGGGFRADRLKPYAGDFKEDQKLFPGDIAVALTDVTQTGEVVGRPIRIPSNNNTTNVLVASLDIAKVAMVTNQVWTRWLYYRLQAPDYTGHVTASTTGTTVRHLSPTDILRFVFPLPPFPEQRAIAEVLGALDDKIEANRRVIDLLESLISARWEDVSSDSSGWLQQPISEVAKIVGGSTPRTSVTDFWNGSISWATPKDLSRLTSTPLFRTERTITEQGLQQISSGLLPRGTVLLSSRAPIGYLAIAEVPLAINQGFIALNSLGVVPNLYLWQWVAHHMAEIKDRANGTTFQEISKANFRSIEFDIPPAEVIDRWMNEAEPLYQLVVKLENETSILANLRDMLLPKLMSGELRVRDAEPVVEDAL